MVPVLGVMGCILGFLVTGAVVRGLFVQWHSLGIPPEKAKKIVAADYVEVFVATENGSLFRFKAQNWIWSGAAPIGSWIPATNPQVEEVEEFKKCNNIAPFAPPIPANIIDFVQFGYCPEPIIDVRYAVLDDGSVMRWSTPDGIGVAIVAIPIGIGAGIVVGLLLAIIVWRRTRSTPSEIEESNT